MSIENFKLNHFANFHKWKRESSGYYDIGIFANVVKNIGAAGYTGACRYGNASLDDTIHIVTYDEDLNLISNNYVTSGEDPRCFMYRDIPYALTWKPYNLNGDIVLDYKLINLKTREVILLNVEGMPPSALKVLGKNWMPLVRDDILYIVIALEPQLLIVRLDIATGKCIWEVGKFQGFVDVTLSRGGTPFLYCEKINKFIGLGHRSYTAQYHTPFFYTLSYDFSSVEIGEDIITGKEFVQDPQSIFYVENKYFCCIGNWNVPSDGSVDIYEIII